MFDDIGWDVVFDEKVKEKIEQLEDSNGELKNNISKTIGSVARNPLKGDPKTACLKGYRSTHVEHLVLVWELTPQIIDVQHLDDLEEIYFYNITHHDDMRDAIAGKTPVSVSPEFTIEFDSLDVHPVISSLYEQQGVNIIDEHWETEAVTVTGEVQSSKVADVEQLLPDYATFEVDSTSVIPGSSTG